VTSIAPEIQSVLDWEKRVGEQYAGLDVPRRRKALLEEHDRELRRRGVVVEQVAAVAEHRIPVAAGEIRVRVYTPPGARPHPVFLHFHGGGFVFGTIDSVFNDAKCAHICIRTPCVVATVEYRLAPEHRFPTAVEDCYAALCWIVEHAAQLDVDAARVAVGGESAGGNLAAAVALMSRDRGAPTLALQLLEVPVTDVSEGFAAQPSVGLFADGYGLDRAAMEEFNRSYLADVADGLDPYASPLLAPDLGGVAPAHVLTAEFDVLRDGGEAYARRLEQAGVETALHRGLGHTHGSSGLWQEWQPARAWMDEAVAALHDALHPSR
jgi:acetyl esterase